MERTILRTVKDVETWFASCTRNIALDTETTDLRYDKLELLGISIYDSKRVCYINLFNNPERVSIINQIVTSFSALSGLIGHNLSFDLMVLSKYKIPWEHCKLFDTMVAYHLIDEEGDKGLKKLANKYLSVEEPVLYEDAAKKGFDSDFFCDYAMNDAFYTGQLYIIFKRELIELELDKLMRLEMEFLPCVVEMQTVGVTVDAQKVEEIRVKLQKKIMDLHIEMCEILGEKYSIAQDLLGGLTVESKTNFNSGKQLGVILYDKLKLPIPGNTDGGLPMTGREALDKLKGKHPFVDKLALYKKCQKLMNGFIEKMPALIDSDGRVRCRFNTCGTVTGRLSSDSPNLQNIPKESKKLGVAVREIFVASPGYTMISADYSGQEVVVMAHISQDQEIMRLINEKQDPHLKTAKYVFHADIPVEVLSTEHPKYEEFKDKFKPEREKAKIFNFALPYGKGAHGYAKDYNITKEEAQKLLDDYYSVHSNLKNAMDATRAELSKNGVLRSMTGRLRHFTKVEDKWGRLDYTQEAYRQSFNFLVQGFSADMIRMAMVAVAKRRRLNPEWDLRTLMTVHDEAVYEVKTEYLEAAKKAVQECFVGAVKLSLPLSCSVSHGKNYDEAK